MPYTVMNTPLGPIGIRWQGESLLDVDLDPAPPRTTPLDQHSATGGEHTDQDPRHSDQCADMSTIQALPATIGRQLMAYFEQGSRQFDLPLALHGTPFQQRVWAALRDIPFGETRTYGEIARQLGSAPRAVGQACRANPCPIVVPCHRVVGARDLGGFSGDTSGRLLATKRWLLRHEGVRISDDR